MTLCNQVRTKNTLLLSVLPCVVVVADVYSASKIKKADSFETLTNKCQSKCRRIHNTKNLQYI